MSNVSSQTALAVFSRLLAAIIGGYLFSNLFSIALSYLLPMPTVDSVLLSLQLSFLFYGAAIIWVFSAKTATRAWLGLLIFCLINAMAIYYWQPESLQ
jgi:hypothetical protein